jgi:hypothetical protein
MVNTVQQIGGAIGTAVFSSLASVAVATYLASHVATVSNPMTFIDATIAGDRLVFWAASGVFLLCGVVTAILFQSRSPGWSRSFGLN